MKNLGPATRRAQQRCAKPGCLNTFRKLGYRPHRRYCSKQCSADCRPRLSRVLAGRKSGEARRGMTNEALHARVEGLTPAQAFLLGRKFFKQDYGNRAKTIFREGYSEGYEAGYDEAVKAQKQIA